MFLVFKNRKDSTYAKVIGLLSLVSVCLLLLVVVLYFYMRIQEKEIFKSSNQIYNNEIHTLLNLNSESFTSISIDVTYWDEFVDFTKTRNLEWFNVSVANLLDAYKLEYVSVYTNEGTLITKVSTAKIKTKDFIPKEAVEELLKKKIDHFYLKIPEGVVEIFAATIHPSNDPFKNKTNPSGCFFMARLLDNEYFADIEKISTSNIKFYEGNEKAVKTVYTIVPLKDYNDKLVSELYFKRAYNIDFWITKTILFIMGIAIVFSWIIYYTYAKKWSKLPLSFIKRILRDGDQASINSLKNIKGEFRYIGKLFEDNQIKTKELQIAKDKAEESDKLKSAFLMNLSHEVRTPMNAILGFSDLLSNTDLSPEDKEKYIRIIKESGKNLIEIIDDLVEMSKIDSNIIKPNLTAVDLNKVLDDIEESYKVIQQNSKIEFKFSRENLNKKIITDKTKLTEIIVNLLNNAFKFTNEGFVIFDCKIKESKNEICFTVKDSGIGIPDELQKNVFKRFSKLSSTGISANEGLGLGLAITKAYIEMLKGKISFKSQVNVGTTFNFSIPLQYLNEELEVSSKASEKQPLPKDLGKEKLILIAEDDNINFLLIEKILKDINFNIIRAHDGVEAVAICKENKAIDLILMDIKMPNLDGYEAFKQIREFNTDIPIIAQTSYSFQEELDKIEALSFTDFISKPIQKSKLNVIIQNYLKE